MKISKKAGSRIFAVGLLGTVGCFGSCAYTNCQVTKPYSDIVEIDKQRDKLEDDHLNSNCVPDDNREICQQIREQYVSRLEQKTVTIRSDEYRQMTESKEHYSNLGWYLFGGLGFFLGLTKLGGVVYTRRKTEEWEERKRNIRAKVLKREREVRQNESNQS